MYFEYKKSFVKTIGRSGLEELWEKGYSNKEIAAIYEISLPTLYHSIHLLYGKDWKKAFNQKKAVQTLLIPVSAAV